MEVLLFVKWVKAARMSMHLEAQMLRFWDKSCLIDVCADRD